MLGWFKKSTKATSKPAGVDFERMLQIVDEWGEFIETHTVGLEIVDERLLPHPKETLLDALCVSLAVAHSEEMKGAFVISALTLAHYQPGVGPKPLGPGGISPEFMRVAGSLPVDEAMKHLAGDPGAAARYEAASKLMETDRQRILVRIEKAQAVAAQLAKKA